MLTCLAGGALLALPSPAPDAQVAGGDFDIRRSTVVLGGTIGQPDTGYSSGSSYELYGGFWAPAASDLLFRDSYEN